MTARLVSEIARQMSPLLLWLPALGMIVGANLFVTWLRRPLGIWRWPLALFVALSPALCPLPGTFEPSFWGQLTTVVTTLAIASAARLPDLDHLLRVKHRSPARLFLWMMLPVARLDKPSESRAHVRRRALRLIGRAALKRLAWEPIAWSVATFLPTELPWLVWSALLIIYFVLSITAAADLFSGICLLLGSDVDPIFDSPFLAHSPRDFWSKRWNKFINRFALKHVALPLRKKASPALVILAVFVVSGIFHEYFSWGVTGGTQALGWMSLFFVVQGGAVWLGSRVPLPLLPRWIGNVLTFAWMVATSPLFFRAVKPALLAFQYPEAWLPY